MSDLCNFEHELRDREVVRVILESRKTWELRDHENPKEKCVDLEAFKNGKKIADLEIEHRSEKSTGGWGKDLITYPYKTLSIPFRKWKLCKGFNPHYIVLSGDYHCWAEIWPNVIQQYFQFDLPSELEFRPRDSRGEPINRLSSDMPKSVLNDLLKNHPVNIRRNAKMNLFDWGDMFFNVPSHLVKWGHAVGD